MIPYYDHNKGTYVIDAIADRIKRQKKTWLGAVIGEPGSGKSYTSIELACAIMNKTVGKSLDPNKHIAYNPIDFVEKLKALKLRKAAGEGVVFEEVGVNVSASTWQSRNNILVGWIFETFRKDNIFCILNTPDISFFDSHTRKLLTTIIELPDSRSIDFEKKQTRAKWLNIKVNRRYATSKWGNQYYTWTPRFIDPTLGLTKVDYVKFACPPDRINKEYEANKDSFRSELDNNIIDELKSERDLKKGKRLLVKKVIAATTDKIMKDLKD